MKRRILWMPTFYLAEAWNGIDEHLLALARRLDGDRFELTVVQRDSDGSQTGTLARRAGIELIDGPPHGLPFVEHVRALRECIRAANADLVHVHTPVVTGESRVALAARLSRVPAILTVHQVQPQAERTRSKAVNRVTQEALFSRTIAVSQDVRASLASRTGLNARRIVVVPNGVEGGPFYARPAPAVCEPVRLLCMARLSPEKGIDSLLRAFALVARQRPNVCLRIAGDGPERGALEQLSKDLALARRVEFLGYVSDPGRLLQTSDVLVHTPRYEGFGLVVAEAMEAGLPVVATPVEGGIRDMVCDRTTGVLSRDSTPGAIAEALLAVIDDPERRQRMGLLGRRRWQRYFTAERMAERTAGIYARHLGEPEHIEWHPE